MSKPEKPRGICCDCGVALGPRSLETGAKRCRKCYALFQTASKKTPRCHPNRQHMAHGLCQDCYNKKKVYGTDHEHLIEMFLAQNGLCAICQEPLVEGRRQQVDHCHTTGQIRGLLCCGCNRGLSGFRDNPEYMTRAIAYVQKWDGLARIEEYRKRQEESE